MMKIMFMPVRILSGVIAGLLGKKLFEGVWRLFDSERAPDPEYREVRLAKLIGALLLEGAIFRAVRGLVDHGSRVAFSRFTGSWPGRESPERQPD